MLSAELDVGAWSSLAAFSQRGSHRVVGPYMGGFAVASPIVAARGGVQVFGIWLHEWAKV